MGHRRAWPPPASPRDGPSKGLATACQPPRWDIVGVPAAANPHAARRRAAEPPGGRHRGLTTPPSLQRQTLPPRRRALLL